MSAASHNRGSRAIRAQIDREFRGRRSRERFEPCNGRFENGPGKRFGRCGRCRAIDYDKYEGDRCTREIKVVYINYYEV